MTTTDQKSLFKYNPQYQPNQLICGTGQTAVVTGWTVKQAIAKYLQPSEFAVIGQLYSPTRGISFLIRNLLANPHVRFLVIINATKEDRNARACECLLDFFKNGFSEGFTDNGQKCWVIRSDVPGYIDIQIEASALEQLRQSIECKEAETISDAVIKAKEYAQKEVLKAWGSPLIFPLTKVVPTVLPGPRYGHRIEGETIAETWVKIIHSIKTTGTIRPSRYDSRWQELIDITAIVTKEPDDFYFPTPNYLPCNRSFIEQYVSQILGDSSKVTSAEEGVEYTYGKRLRSWLGEYDQIELVIQKLALQIDSASAVMSLWDVHDHEPEKSPPCLNHIWVRVVDNELSLTATFRSNDMFSAWPANAIGLRALQRYILDEIVTRTQYNLSMGPLITVSQSAHIYEECWENADKLIQSEYISICQQRKYDDPSGNFVITLQDGKILVERTTPGMGEVVKFYSGKSANQLYQQIAADCPSLQVEHAMYLGTELQKAELTVLAKNSLVYEQDKLIKKIN
jgi:thymidylate synthase